MDDTQKVIDAFRNCITEPKCRNCPWESCEKFNQPKVTIPVDLALEVNNLLISLTKGKEEEEKKRHRLMVHNLGNVDVPDWMTMNQFYHFMDSVVSAVEHTEKGESWPYGKE